MKTCKRCTQDKPLDDFTVDTRYKDGRYPWCAECRAAYRRERRHGAKRDETLAYFRDWNDQNRDRVRELNNSNYHRHKDEYSEKRRIYDRKQWHNDPKYRAKKNRYKNERYASDPEFNRKRRGWSVVTSHRRRKRVRGTGTHFTQAEWRALCAKYNHCCLCCGQQKPLSPDHVIPIARGGSNAIENIQPLCRDCNARKGTQATDYRPGWGD